MALPFWARVSIGLAATVVASVLLLSMDMAAVSGTECPVCPQHVPVTPTSAAAAAGQDSSSHAAAHSQQQHPPPPPPQQAQKQDPTKPPTSSELQTEECPAHCLVVKPTDGQVDTSSSSSNVVVTQPPPVTETTPPPKPKKAYNPRELPEGCRLEFLQYVPSVWETDWRRGLEDNNNRVCEALWERQDLPYAWEQAVADRLRDPSKFWKVGGGPADPVMSRMDYKIVCDDDDDPNDDIVGAVLEPLVGLLRHPRACPTYLPPNVSPIEVQDYHYVMPAANVSLVPGGHAAFGGRNIQTLLFDLGSSMWDPSKDDMGWSQQFLTTQYTASGFTVNRFVAWEAKAWTAAEAWRYVPDSWRPVYVWVNVPCEATIGGGLNPWTWVKRLARPQDFVAFKLDIDTPTIEQPLVDQLSQDRELQALVDDFYYEYHHDNPAMYKHYKNAFKGTLAQATDCLVNLRKAGVRAHGWP